MAGGRLEVYWSPNSPDKFLTWGSDLSLYQVKNTSGRDDIASAHNFQISSNSRAYQLGSFTDVAFAKCLAWLPVPELEGVIAIGQTNGRILLTSVLGPGETSPFHGKEYASKHNRQCNAVSWGLAEPYILAAGFEKHRSEHGLILWDVAKGVNDSNRPIMEMAFGDTITSVTWFNHSHTMATGVNSKQLRLYDFRDGTKHTGSTNTRAVFSIVQDPFVNHRFASYSDTSVCIWDVRNFEKPVLSLQQNKTVSKISWCPTHHSFLGVLCKESTSLSLYDIQNANGLAAEEMEPIPLERGLILTENGETISSFAWHLNEENRLLYSTSSLNIKEHIVVDRITLNWSPSSKLVWNCGKKILQYIDETDSVYGRFSDFSVIMRKRAVEGYGLEADFKPDSELMQDVTTRELWCWVDTCRKLAQSGNPLGINFMGIRSALRLDTDGVMKSEMFQVPWNGVESAKISPITVYRSEERNQALRLCGWPYDPENSILGPLLEKFQADGQVSRSAALSVFHMKIRKAIKILTRSGVQKNQVSYQLVALALAGFTDNRETLWQQEICSMQKNALDDPYLRATFAFLTSPSEKYESVLNETGMSVRDRIGFACNFLSDAHLSEFIEYLNRQLTKEGNLDGMLLTGLSTDGLNLLQSHVDKTGDIQTVSLLSLHASNQEVSKDGRMQQWVNNYRSLLDSWRLWTQRAKFDVQFYKGNPSGVEKPPQQVYVSCNYCGKGISVFSGGKSKLPFSRSSPNVKSKLTGCPNCRNPLPRCAVCMMHLGSPLASWGGPTEHISKKPSINVASSVSGVTSKKSHPFASWILWCQTCRHGGHSAHLLEWFAEHSECPVTGCSCRCLNLDTIGHHIPVIANGHD